MQSTTSSFAEIWECIICESGYSSMQVRICPESSQSNQHNIYLSCPIILSDIKPDQNAVQLTSRFFAKPVCIKENLISCFLRLYGWIKQTLVHYLVKNVMPKDWLVNFLFVPLFLWNFRKCLFSFSNIHNVLSSVNCPQLLILILEIPAMDTLEVPHNYCAMTACEGLLF